MKLLIAILLAAIYFAVLWSPAILVARRLSRNNTPYAYRCLRVILPMQLVATVVLLVAADVIGLRNPAGLMALATVGVSAAGAAVMVILSLVTLKY